jgi:hypothetical protein
LVLFESCDFLKRDFYQDLPADVVESIHYERFLECINEREQIQDVFFFLEHFGVGEQDDCSDDEDHKPYDDVEDLKTVFLILQVVDDEFRKYFRFSPQGVQDISFCVGLYELREIFSFVLAFVLEVFLHDSFYL